MKIMSIYGCRYLSRYVMFPFLSSVSVISAFLCPKYLLSTQCKKQNSAVIFLTDATEQPVRAKITPHEAVSIV